MKDKNLDEFPVKLEFEKRTQHDNSYIDHEFLCNGGEDNCSGSIGSYMYLTHLQFKESVHVYDDTSVPFSGNIFIANTRYAGALGCPLSNVQVCLINERNIGPTKTNETLVCGHTEPDGWYSLPVIEGSRVDYVDIIYKEHQFKPHPDSAFEGSTVITAENEYIYNDFIDVQKARLIIDVVGGLCNKKLGTSSIQVKIAGCDWNGKDGGYIQTNSRQIYNSVPAHILEVQVMDIVDPEDNERYTHIWDHFQGDAPIVEVIDLRSTAAADEVLKHEADQDMDAREAKNFNVMENEEEESMELVRFQFDGDLQIKVDVGRDSFSKECAGEISLDDYNSANSAHVLEYMSAFNVTIEFVYEIIKNQIYCDVVPSNLKLQVENQVGVDDNEGFEDFLNAIDEKSKQLLYKCKDGCLYDIQHKVNEDGKNVSAHVIDIFATGRPNVVSYPYAKYMSFSIQGGTSSVDYKSAFVVEGYYSPGEGRSFALPTHKPIMILRDPPGGLSSATYKNIKTTLKLETSSISSKMSNKFGLGIKGVVNVPVEMCTGGGLGAIVITCQKLFDYEQTSNIFDMSSSLGGVIAQKEKKKSNSFSTTWSYATSSNPAKAGAMSDVFVVPNLNVMYQEVTVVEWNKEECSVETEVDGSLPVTTTFDIKSPSSQPALAFFSRDHINNIKLPELNSAKKNKEVQKDDCNCTVINEEKQCTYTEANGNEGTIQCSELLEQIISIQDGINGWKTTLTVEKDIYDSNTVDPNKAINNWFEQVGSQDMNVGAPLKINNQDSGLAPPSLLSRKEALDNTLIKGEEDNPVKRIQFSGGGSKFSMTLSKNKVWDEVGLSCWDGCNVENSNNIKAPGLDDLTVKAMGVGLKMRFSLLDLNIDVSHKSTKKESDTESTTIGFVLGDGDAGDEFVVDLYYDEKYGTIIFKTVGGQSKCPHEKDTAAIEDPRMVITSRPSQHVFPDKDMIFEVDMSNVGVGDSKFVLYANEKDNEDGLKLVLDKNPFVMETKKTFKKTVVVQRGPRSYQYTSIDLVLESACKDRTKSDTTKLYNVQPDEDEFLIKFVEPCPKVEWAGELKRDRHFIVNTHSYDEENLEVTVVNPSHGERQDNTFYDMTLDRLEKVILSYRKLDELHWKIARTDITDTSTGIISSEELDFAASYAEKEDEYGYNTMAWALGTVPEGTYEVKVETKCTQLGGPADIDMFSTEIFSGVKDLTRPEQYGDSLPLRDSIMIGEEIVVVFTEPIQCEKPFTFDIRIKVGRGKGVIKRDMLHVICEGRKIAFQINPMKVKVKKLLGKTIKVQIGKLPTNDESDILDKNGNSLDGFVEFEKIVADIDLDQASTSFIFTLEDMACSPSTVNSYETEVKEQVALLLDLESINSIQVGSMVCSDNMKVTVTIYLEPNNDRRSLRVESFEDSVENDHPLGLFEKLHDISLKQKNENATKSQGTRLLIDQKKDVVFSVSGLKILPSNSDTEKFLKTDPKLLDEEERMYSFASSTSHADRNQPTELIMKKMDVMTNDVEKLLEKMQKESETDMKMELFVVTIACVCISMVTLFHLKR